MDHSRRRFVQRVVGGALVFGFDLRARSWVTRAAADSGTVALPALDGELRTTGLEPYATDFGRIVSLRSEAGTCAWYVPRWASWSHSFPTTPWIPSSRLGGLQLAAEIEILAAQYWHTAQLGQLHVPSADEFDRERRQLAGYGQRRRGPRGR